MMRAVAWAIVATALLGVIVVYDVLTRSTAAEASPIVDWSSKGMISHSQRNTLAIARPLCVGLASDQPFVIDDLTLEVDWMPVHDASMTLGTYSNSNPITVPLPASPASMVIGLKSGMGSAESGPHVAQLAITSFKTNGSFSFTQPVELTLKGIASAPVHIEIIGCWRSE